MAKSKINNEITATYTKLQENSIKSHNQYVEATSSTNDVPLKESTLLIVMKVMLTSGNHSGSFTKI